MKYIAKEVPFTQKHQAWNAELDDGRFVARFWKANSAANFARYMNEHQIFSRKQWNALPIKVRRAFISATSEVAPNFYQ